MTLESLSEKSKSIQTMFDKISPRYDILNRILSFGQDIRWRKTLVRQMPFIPSQQGVLCDVACGTGDILLTTFRMRKDYTRFWAVDISGGMLKQAKEKLLPFQKNITFSLASGENLPLETQSVDCLSVSFGLRNIEHRAAALGEFWRVLKPGGKLLILDFFEPESTVLSWGVNVYFKRILPTLGGMFSDKQAYQYLPQSVSTMPSPPVFLQTLQAQGFKKMDTYSWLAGTTRLFCAYKPC
jgi:demethylmenaquinone methyltransferase / 2-methoxy-6-polyprenyl-1,4-benzoquinol methylase